jgi:hypothetical protein
MKKELNGMKPLTENNRTTWLQTDRETHELWAELAIKKPRAAALMHIFCAHMDKSSAVVASHSTLAKLCGFSTDTVKRAIKDLVNHQWVQVVKIGGNGAACAYVVNARVAWSGKRDKLGMATFDARVLSLREDQDTTELNAETLRRVPILKFDSPS